MVLFTPIPPCSPPYAHLFPAYICKAGARTGAKLFRRITLPTRDPIFPQGQIPCVNLCVKSSPNIPKMGKIDQNVQKLKVSDASKLSNKRGWQNCGLRLRSPALYPAELRARSLIIKNLQPFRKAEFAQLRLTLTVTSTVTSARAVQPV